MKAFQFRSFSRVNVRPSINSRRLTGRYVSLHNAEGSNKAGDGCTLSIDAKQWLCDIDSREAGPVLSATRRANWVRQKPQATNTHMAIAASKEERKTH